MLADDRRALVGAERGLGLAVAVDQEQESHRLLLGSFLYDEWSAVPSTYARGRCRPSPRTCSPLRSRSCSRRRDALRPGPLVTYSPKVFVPLTTLCRDVCGYCTFARPPRRGERAFLTEEEVLAIARAGAAAGCREALFTLGDKPELRYKVAREELASARLRDDARVPRALRARSSSTRPVCSRT